MGWFSASNNNRDLYVADYSKLYGDTIFPTMRSVERGEAVLSAGLSTTTTTTAGDSDVIDSVIERPWVDSSPSNGLYAAPLNDPYAKLWGAASTAAAGDVHFYSE